ncbi:transcription termination factor MTERF2, chloroplastic isoform X1 [Amborella trichopoda]|uniref:transcription termination factor MTERF2, chloroplastic isoform X1 n=1 Tax=Amborella trichopoda TaxID=13333 RepID=UPI0009C075C3|nr:transcription termination factor MTERF2, chloroplastic isoform X1 [Amborella trichopoda]|eukprot:XP_020529398.1 transcription termination factor MTERF2, chloroplastic isoform X1 [Amborella trichopoda]
MNCLQLSMFSDCLAFPSPANPKFHHFTNYNNHKPNTLSTKPLIISSSCCCCYTHKEHRKRSNEEGEGEGDASRVNPALVVTRTQNARSMATVLRLSPSPPILEPSFSNSNSNSNRDDERERLLSLPPPPTFPGSVSSQRARSTTPCDGNGDLASISLSEGAETSQNNDSNMSSMVMLSQALEIRREATSQLLKEAMKAAKFSITYSENLTSHMAGFVDHILIEAASMKNCSPSNSPFSARVKSCLNNSGVVPLIRWLKHNSLTYPQIGKIISLSAGNLETLKTLVEWLKSIYVRGRSIGVVLAKEEVILNRNTNELDDIIHYLETNGVRRDWTGFVISRCPKILSFTMEELKSRVNFYLELGMDEKDFGTMVFDYPKALGFFSLEEMNSKVNYLKEFGLGMEDVGRLLAFKPQLMGCGIEERWKPLVKYFYYLGICRDGMKRILTMKPMIFCVDLESTIAPKVQFLQDIGVREDAIGSALVKFPPLLTYSLYKKIRPVVQVIFLITKAGVPRKDIGKVIGLEPQLLGCSIAGKLDVNVKYFLSLGIPFQSLGEMIVDFPMLLRYNLDVLRPKYRYLRRIMVRALRDLIEFPRFFSYSLENRIIPRHKILVENRINFKLRYMLVSPDSEFNKRVEAALDRRRRFESGSMSHTNHNSISSKEVTVSDSPEMITCSSE